MTSFSSGKGVEISEDIYYYTNQIVNVVMVGKKNEDGWVLIDAGMPKSGKELINACRERFGLKPPAAIVLTHGHFDHIGSIVDLIREWNVPVYAHHAEFPFLTGQQAYPEPDVTVEGGMLAKISSIYPNEPIQISEALKSLPADGSVPFLNDFKWHHTPGHTPGHVSFFRERDRVLIAGDAFVTVRTDSFYKVLVQKEEVNGPPRYFTTDWTAAERSVKLLQGLAPEVVITGHGPAMAGPDLKQGLDKLVKEWNTVALPDHGKYV
jgi:glyoxylase-like metal-dependent hydrolase (beta-lactamase superfamily II)